MRKLSFVAPVALALALSALGCTPTVTGRPVQHQEGANAIVDVKDDEFAASLHQILKTGEASPERNALLAGVVRRQLAHADARFLPGRADRGVRSVLGALYLVRSGEGRAEMIDAAAARALGGAIERFAARGDEGRALVLMKMRAASLAQGSKERTELEEHIAVLEGWSKDGRTGGPVARAGADERAAVGRALVDPSEASIKAAADAIEAWLAAASVLDEAVERGERVAREEAGEAEHAFGMSEYAMASLFLRYGDAKGALDNLDRPTFRRVRPRLLAPVHAAATLDRSREWLALSTELARLDPRVPGDMDQEQIFAALWGSTLEAYRRDPSEPHAALMLSQLLVRLGLHEAAPLVANDALAKPAGGVLPTALDVVLGALADAAEAEDASTARRVYAASAPLLAIADRTQLKDPSPARARQILAQVELREGNLAAAKPLLEHAVTADPSVTGFLNLALVERQTGNLAAAASRAQQALAAPDARKEALDVAEAHLLLFELGRAEKRDDRAKAELDAALALVLPMRKTASSPGAIAHAERLLGRILDAYGDARGASRALERALAAAEKDRPALGATVLEAVGRALVRKDLPAARAALRHGLEAELGDEDLVYAGLWVWLLEQELKQPGDGSSERALGAGKKSSWTGKLASWAGGKLSDNDLVGSAATPSQRVEVEFYTAMKRRLAGDPTAQDKLKAVSTAPLLDLLEVQIAREITAPRVNADLPKNAPLP